MSLLHTVFSILLFLSFLFPQFETDSPEEIVEQYLDLTLKRSDFKSAYSLLARADKSIKTQEDFIQENIIKVSDKIPKQMANAAEKINQVVRENTSWKILGTTNYDKRLVVKIMLSTLDLEKAVYEIFQELLLPTLSGDLTKGKEHLTIENTQSKFLDILNSVGLIVEEKEYTVLNEVDGWKLFIDFKKTDRVNTLLVEAQEDMKVKELENAIVKYEKVLEIDRGNTQARKMIEYLSELQKFQAIVDEIQKHIQSGEIELAKEKLNQLSETDFKNPMVEAMLKTGVEALKNTLLTMQKIIDSNK